MQYNFQVENIRCGGCSNTITSKLKGIEGVVDVLVKVEDKQVIVTTEESVQAIPEGNPQANIKQVLIEKLTKLGYPQTGSAGANRLKAKATSVVSCAIGKVSGKG
jgi:copper chaperone